MEGRYSDTLKYRATIATVLIYVIHLVCPKGSLAQNLTPTEPADAGPSGTGPRSEAWLLAILPCVSYLREGVEVARVLEECDLLTHAAVSLAVERVNREDSGGILSNHTMSVVTLSDEEEDPYVSW